MPRFRTFEGLSLLSDTIGAGSLGNADFDYVSGSANSGDASVSVPTGVADGDLVLVPMFEGSSTFRFYDEGQGLSYIANWLSTSNNLLANMAYKVASSESGSYAAANADAMAALAFRSSTGGNYFWSQNGANFATSSATLTLPTFTTAITGYHLFVAFQDNSGGGVSSGPSGMSLLLNAATSGKRVVVYGLANQTGVIPAKTLTWSSAAFDSIGFHMVLGCA